MIRKSIRPMRMAITLMVFAMPVVSLAAGTPAGKVDLTEALIQAVDVYRDVLVHRFDGSPRRDMADSPSHPAVLWLDGPIASAVDRNRLATAGIVLKDKQQVCDEQLASFIKLSKVTVDDQGVAVTYSVPAQASDGRLLIERVDGKLLARHEAQGRSASGARHVYAALYARRRCIDQSEMAYRWNFDRNEMAAAHGPYPGDCPAPEFPQVEAYPATP